MLEKSNTAHPVISIQFNYIVLYTREPNVQFIELVAYRMAVCAPHSTSSCGINRILSESFTLSMVIFRQIDIPFPVLVLFHYHQMIFFRLFPFFFFRYLVLFKFKPKIDTSVLSTQEDDTAIISIVQRYRYSSRRCRFGAVKSMSEMRTNITLPISTPQNTL